MQPWYHLETNQRRVRVRVRENIIEWLDVCCNPHFHGEYIFFTQNLNIRLRKLLRWLKELSEIIQWEKPTYNLGTDTFKLAGNQMKTIQVLNGFYHAEHPIILNV